jgi:hypothetical protein
MSGTITLPCWLINSPIKQIFAVRVGYDDIWDSVKDAIKEKAKIELSDIDAYSLDLWKVSHCAICHVLVL